jgi:hypothetical protein
MIAPLARPTLTRLVRSRQSWLSFLAWCSLAIGIALAVRSQGLAHGADHALIGGYGAVVLPLLTYAQTGAALGSRSLWASTAPLVAFGAAPMRAALVSIGVAAAACGAMGSLLAAVVAFVAHGAADPPPLVDALAAAYGGGLGGLAYASWYCLGASFGRSGRGRTLLLVVDWVVGASGNSGAFLTPRGHVRNLLGGAPPMDMSQRTSAILLLSIALLCAAAAARRTARTLRR